MNDVGYFKLHRAFFQHRIWRSAPVAWGRVALAIMANVNWKPGLAYDGTGVAAGSLLTSQEHLSDAARVTRQQCRAALAYLSRIQFITASTTKKHTLITLVNWATYQGVPRDEESADEPTKNQQGTKPQPIDSQRTTTIKKGKKVSREAGIKNRLKIPDHGSAKRDENVFLKANLEDLTLLREELSRCMGEDPPSDVLKKLLQTLRERELSVGEYALHLRSLPDEYLPEYWTWFSTVAKNLSPKCVHGTSREDCDECEREERQRQVKIANAAKALDRSASAADVRSEKEAQAS